MATIVFVCVELPDGVFEDARDRDPVGEAVLDFVDERDPVVVRVASWVLVPLAE